MGSQTRPLAGLPAGCPEAGSHGAAVNSLKHESATFTFKRREEAQRHLPQLSTEVPQSVHRQHSCRPALRILKASCTLVVPASNTVCRGGSHAAVGVGNGLQAAGGGPWAAGGGPVLEGWDPSVHAPPGGPPPSLASAAPVLVLLWEPPSPDAEGQHPGNPACVWSSRCSALGAWLTGPTAGQVRVSSSFPRAVCSSGSLSGVLPGSC